MKKRVFGIFLIFIVVIIVLSGLIFRYYYMYEWFLKNVYMNEVEVIYVNDKFRGVIYMESYSTGRHAYCITEKKVGPVWIKDKVYFSWDVTDMYNQNDSLIMLVPTKIVFHEALQYIGHTAKTEFQSIWQIVFENLPWWLRRIVA